MAGIVVLEILDWVFLVAALVVLVLQFQATNSKSYNALNSAFWVLMAACFLINGLESSSWWMWLWFIAAAASLVAAFAGPTSRGTARFSE